MIEAVAVGDATSGMVSAKRDSILSSAAVPTGWAETIDSVRIEWAAETVLAEIEEVASVADARVLVDPVAVRAAVCRPR